MGAGRGPKRAVDAIAGEYAYVIIAPPGSVSVTKRATKATPLVAGSGQGWKVTLGLAALVVAAAASVFPWLGPEELKTAAIAVALASGLVGVAAMLAVRCPSCGRSLGVWAFQTGSLTTWHERLVEVAECPSCGHREPGSAGARR